MPQISNPSPRWSCDLIRWPWNLGQTEHESCLSVLYHSMLLDRSLWDDLA